MQPHSSVVLPVECLQEVVSHCHDSTTLFSLLTVSKAVSGIAARKLYADPFAILHEREHTSSSGGNRKINSGRSSSAKAAVNGSKSTGDKGKKDKKEAAATPIFSLIHRILEDSPANDPLTNALRAACHQTMDTLASLPAQASSSSTQSDHQENNDLMIGSTAKDKPGRKKKAKSKGKSWKQTRKPNSSTPSMDYLSFIRHISCSHSMLEKLSAVESMQLCMPILSDQEDITSPSVSLTTPPVVTAPNHTESSITTIAGGTTSPGSSTTTQASNEHGNSPLASDSIGQELENGSNDEEEEEEQEDEGVGGDEDEENQALNTSYPIGMDKAYGRLLEHLAWIICSHQPHQIRTLHLPAEHLLRFKRLLPKLTSLETTVVDIKRALLEGKIPERCQGILDFAKTFVRLYGDQRETIVELDNGFRPVPMCPQCAIYESTYSPLRRANGISSSASSNTLKVLLKHIREILPPLNCPRFLTSANWAHFRTKAASTNLAHVRTLEYETRQSLSDQITPFDPDALTWEGSQADLLKRCRSLRSLKLVVWEKDAFRWAVEEKMRALGQHQRLGSSIVDNSNSSPDGHHEAPLSTLVQLQRASISCEADTVRDVMDDFLFAFGHSIQSVDFSLSNSPSWSESNRKALLQENHAIGQQWRLSHLTHLSILSRTPVLLASSAFCDCHNMINMVLYDTLERADPTEIIWQDVWHMPKLANLKLVGTLAVAFNPASMASMTKLKSIKLVGPRVTKALEEELLASSTFARTNEGKEAIGHSGGNGEGALGQYRWPWREWSLPSLEKIEFRGWPAHGFDLSALHRCPRLQDLLLDCRGYDGHREMYLPSVVGSTNDSDAVTSPSSSTKSPTDINLTNISTKLVCFRLVGPWALTDTTLKQLLVGLNKRLEYLYLSDCQQYTTEVLIQCSKPMLRLGYIYCSRSISPEQARQFGLAPPANLDNIIDLPKVQGTWGKCSNEDSDGEDSQNCSDEDDVEVVGHCDYLFNGRFYRYKRT